MARIIGTAGSAPEAKPKKKAYRVPAGDRAGATGIAKANAYKRTPAYKRTIRKVYVEQPLAQRKADARAVARVPAKQRTTEQRQIASVHGRRHAADLALAREGAFSSKPVRSLLKSQDRAVRALGLLELSGYHPSDKELAKKLGWSKKQFAKYHDVLNRDPVKAGFTPDFGDKVAAAVEATGLGPYTSAAAVVEGLVRHPGETALHTAKSLPLAAAAIPAALINTPLHPIKTTAAFEKSLATPYPEKVKRVVKEGALQDVGNAAIGLGPLSRGLGGVLLKDASRADKLVSGGAREAVTTKGAVRYAIGHVRDKARAAKYERKARPDSGKELSALEAEALARNRAAGRAVAVVPAFSAKRIARHAIAKPRGRAVAALRYSRAHGPLAKLAATRFKLNKDEKKALWPAMEVGIHTPAAARQHLPGLIAKIEESRTRAPAGHYKRMDVVAQLKDLLANPEKHFTPKLQAVLADIKKNTDAITALDPQFKTATKEGRRRAVQAFHLDLHPGEAAAPRTMYHVVRDTAVSADTKLAAITAHGIKPSSNGHVYLYDDLAQAEHFARGGGHILKVDVGGLDLGGAEGAATRTFKGTIPAERVATGAVPDLSYAPEEAAAFHARVDAAAKQAGLSEPMYFKHERHRGMQANFGDAVVGGGRATSTGRTFKGANLGQGYFDTSFGGMLRGYEHNVKAHHNYKLIESLNRHNRLTSIVPEPQGVTAGEALDRLAKHEPLLNRESYALVNLGIFKHELPDQPVGHLEAADAAEVSDAGTQRALAAAVVDPTDVKPDMLQTPGWQVWPKEALRELESELTSSRAGGRAIDIGKGLASKAILVTANAPWLALQYLQEFGTTAAATAGRAITPRNVAGTVRWWHGMSDADRADVAGALGLGETPANWSSVKMGSSINRGFGHSWRAMKSADFWHAPRVAGQPVAHIINPLSWMRAADRGKTNMTRLLFAHSELTKKLDREALGKVGSALDGLNANRHAIDRLLPVFDKPGPEQLAYLSKHPEILEHVGDTLNNALGDWTTLTASERMIANRAVMFYPFVRYSARLLFYTLPVEHPIVSSVLAELGQLQVNEYRQIFGNDELPWNLGKVYWGKDGHMESIDLARANPLMNSITQTLTAQNLGQAVGTFPPFVQWAFDQAYHASSFRGSQWRVNGDPSSPYNRNGHYTFSERARILANSALSLTYPYRTAQKIVNPGPQGDDSLLFSPRPISYKKASEITGNSASAKIQRLKATNAAANEDIQQKRYGVGNLLLGPLYPTPSRDVESAAANQQIKKLQTAADKLAAQRKAYRDTHGGKNPTKPKSPFSGSHHKLFSG